MPALVRKMPQFCDATCNYYTFHRIEALQSLAQQGIKTRLLDVTDKASVKSCVSQIEGSAGHIDILICNAGGSEFE